MARWIRFSRDGAEEFGTLEDGTIAVHSGDMFAGAEATGETVALADVEVLTPCRPSKMICLWNNFHELSERLGTSRPPDPLYFLKAPNAFLADGQVIHRPKGYVGNVSSASSSAGAAPISVRRRPATTFSATPASTT